MANALVPADANPAKTSPKVKWGAIITGIIGIIASAVAAVPQETWATLGEAGLPLGIAIGGAAYGVTAYLKRDPAREPNVIRETVVAAPVGQDAPAADPADLVLTEDQAVTDPVVGGDPVARLAEQVGA